MNQQQITNTSATLRLRSGQALSAGNQQQITNNQQPTTKELFPYFPVPRKLWPVWD